MKNISPTKTICFFNSNQAWGGGEKWHFTTAKEFEKRGYKTILATNSNSELYKKAVQEKLNVYGFRVHNLSFLNPIKIMTMVAFLKAKKVDTIILNLPQDLKLAGVAAKIAGVKKIIYRRGMPHPLRNTALNRYLFSEVLTNVVVNSEEIGRSLVIGNESWFPKEKLVLVYNGVDTSKEINKTEKMYERQGDEIVIGNAGRLTEQKGQKYLIEMTKLLVADGMNVKVLIVGEGELKDSLQKQINEAGLQERIKLLGHTNNIGAFFNSLDVFVFPSLYEGSANTLIEALQYGVPTVAWDVSSNPEVIEHGLEGILVKSINPLDLKIEVDYMIKNLKDLKYSKNGIIKVREKFDSKKNLDTLEINV